MENTVEFEAINTETSEQQYDDGAAGVDDISLSDLMQSDVSETGTVVEQPEADAQPEAQPRDDDAQEPIKDQRDFNLALRARLEREREKFQKTPEFLAGQMLLRERMAKDGISAEEALDRIRRERNTEKAQEYAKNPTAFYEDYLNNRQTAYEPRPQMTEAESLAQQMTAAHDAGLVPPSFDPRRDMTAAFVGNLQRYGAEAALEIWKAQQNAATQAEVQRQKAAPRPMRVGGGSAPAPKLDFENMSSEEFAKIDKQIEQSLRMGRRVRF
jgi:hypothetical protein